MALSRLDFPTPELPVKTDSFPRSSSISSGMPFPVSALVQTVGNPAARYISARGSPAARSHLLTQTTTPQSFRAAMADTRSMRNGSVTGTAREATATSWSTLAAAGRSKALRLGSISQTMPSPSPVSFTSTQSPTRGLRPSWRNFPRARQVTVRPSTST